MLFRIVPLFVFIQAFSAQSADPCRPNPCRNGGWCSPSNRTQTPWVQHATACFCKKGWVGDFCERECYDTYKSCERWVGEGRCNWSDRTDFFDMNCAAMCKYCVTSKDTMPVGLPYPPAITPLKFLVGKWKLADSKNNKHFPLDFTWGSNFEEIIDIMIAEVPMFGHVVLNYSSQATNLRDANDVQLLNGFLSINQPARQPPYDAALWSSSNNGLIITEEGQMTGESVSLETTFSSALPFTGSKLPKKVTRTLTKNSGYLMITVDYQANSGQKDSYSHFYFKQ